MPRESERDDLWTDAQPTTILLSRAGDEWRATQRGVAVEGSGPTAPLAAARYCRLIAEDADAAGVGATGAIGDAATDSRSDRWESATSSQADGRRGATRSLGGARTERTERSQ